MKYVVCVPDGAADEPVPELGGRTPLEAAAMPNLALLAASGEVGLAATIPAGFPPGSDVGNLSILGYDPARYHTGRAPIEAAAMGLAGTAGVIVDEVEEVLTVEAEQLDEVPGAGSDAIDAIAKIGDRLVVLLTPDRLVGDAADVLV